jgi:hypothetical protein
VAASIAGVNDPGYSTNPGKQKTEASWTSVKIVAMNRKLSSEAFLFLRQVPEQRPHSKIQLRPRQPVLLQFLVREQHSVPVQKLLPLRRLARLLVQAQPQELRLVRVPL